MSAARSYGALLEETQPEVIHAEEQNRAAISTLERLIAKEDVSAAEAKLIELLLVLVKNDEAEHYLGARRWPSRCD